MSDLSPDHLCGVMFHRPGDHHVTRRCTRDQHDNGAHDDPRRRLLSCLANWPEAWEGEYNPSCCRFPKSCSADVYSPQNVTPADVEPEPMGVPSSSRESSGAVDAETTEQPGAVRPDTPHDHVRCPYCHRTDGHKHLGCNGPCPTLATVPIAPTAETEQSDHGLFMHEVPRYLPSRGRRREEPEDPPGVDVYCDPGSPGSLPPISEAAERVAYFLRAFGDGKIMGREDGLPPLYARDLEVLAQDHDPNRSH